MISLQEMSMLTTLYSQAHRRYHNINHINDCLAELEQFTCSSISRGDLELIERAIWYHDAVYNPYSTQNEIRSAALLPHNVNHPVIREAIYATAKHTVTQEKLDPISQVVLDIDLSGFGKPWHIVERNAQNIRKEYYNTSDFDFYQGRVKFLETIAQRESLYYTDYFKEKYHEMSQKNLKIELDRALDIVDFWPRQLARIERRAIGRQQDST